MFRRICICLCVVFVALSARAQDSEHSQVLFTNVNIFNGTDGELIGADVLVEGNLIKEIGQNLQASGATIVDGGGRTLMPGLMDAHVHLALVRRPS